MVDTRNTTLGGIWANGAEDPPVSPVEEITYADSSLNEAAIEEGWPFSKIVDSAKFNEFMRRVSTIINFLERYGLMPWSPYTDYEVGSWCLGSNGSPYYCIIPTGPGLGAGPRDPVTQTTYWKSYLQDHTNDTAAHSATSLAIGDRIIRRDSNGRARVAPPSASSDIAIKATVDNEASARLSADVTEANARIAHEGNIAAHSATSVLTGNAIVRRDSVGRTNIAAGINSTHAMNLGQLPDALIDLTPGEIGSLAFLARNTVGSSISIGGSYSGSGLRYAGIAAPITTGEGDYTYVSLSTTAPSGTWRALGHCASISGKYPSTLFIRLS